MRRRMVGLVPTVESLCKLSPILLKLLVSSLAILLAFKFIFHSSPDFGPETNLPDRISVSEPFWSSFPPSSPLRPDVIPAKVESANASYPVANSEKCNLFYGEWIPKPSGPAYTNETCNLIESHQNCMRNGRPDTGYLYWKWSPRNCNLPEFDPERFLETMRNKTWALIGDSIARNHVQSLLCILSKVEQAVEIYHDKEYRSKTWLFPSYNLTVSVIWSPFLAEAAIFEDYNGVSTSEIELQLDKLDKTWLDHFHQLDYIILSTGKWFLKTAVYYENNTIVGCHGCPKRNLTELGFDFAYRKVLRSALEFLSSSNHRGMIFFRTSTPDHFEGGDWYNGGACNRTLPHKEGEVEVKDLQNYLRRVELEEFEKVRPTAMQNGVNLKLLDLLPLSLLRPDGHPGPYRFDHPFSKDKESQVISDCLHWCLPGPIDAWNDVILEMVMT